MRNIPFTYWKEPDGKYLGYLNDYPDHWTQGNDPNDLQDHLTDLFELFTSEEIPGIEHVAEWEVARKDST
uniref:Type II toxin-antitoxin system HicB family antitoxin n=1 Tax=Candidatus Kentrum sp. FM TaxID=2126340 RepID=A0A450VWR9_9GAMM|nr:MAG: hypothetical protein BECKFM1743A_GA0114220_100978 [Candidatus Kentron sp. FM]VFJ52289.1 MAG: hypothetical protein BECKFM1743C_GA0114222_101078 [Candidatus Kentron sp. FM]VFK09263.1 MAG: hypothetical protein BECKFM1743B_GA0114221_101008 [Candidatus Kentron sp. FM]